MRTALDPISSRLSENFINNLFESLSVYTMFIANFAVSANQLSVPLAPAVLPLAPEQRRAAVDNRPPPVDEEDRLAGYREYLGLHRRISRLFYGSLLMSATLLVAGTFFSSQCSSREPTYSFCARLRGSETGVNMMASGIALLVGSLCCYAKHLPSLARIQHIENVVEEERRRRAFGNMESSIVTVAAVEHSV